MFAWSDYKYDICLLTEEIADARFHKGFDELTESEKSVVWQAATDAHRQRKVKE